MTKINIYWQDVDAEWGYWQFSNRLAIVSHLQNGHSVVLWYKGTTPKGPYFPDDLVKYFPGKIEIRNADDIVSVDEFIRTADKGIPPENIVRTASDYFSFHLMKTLGENEYYCDADVIALKPFPHSTWILTSDNPEENHVTVGIMKGLKNHPIWDYMILHCKKDWYNVQVFSEAVSSFNLRELECASHWFHPVCWKVAYTNPLNVHFLLWEKQLPKTSYGIHYYNYRLSRIQPAIDESFINKFPTSIFAQLCKKNFVNVPYKRY